jgi:hypothetical protein
MDYHQDDYPRSMRDPEVRQRRRAMLSQPHIAPLADYAKRLRDRLQGEVQDFDPLDGGVNARILFLFEKPGPMTDALKKGKSGSGFISRNNDDATAEATFRFMQTANIPRRDTLIWNVIPWWNGHVKFTGAERTTAIGELAQLLTMLQRLDTAVLVGKTAGKARPYLGSHLRVLKSAHPSPKVRSTNRVLWDRIPDIWREAGSLP